eukprot:CAMPEP_0181312408 /NCGR_PEP_ID=MMETSP1101-20121128/13679_1 /TAXON_ID=46948 /ORGANISM="Rhodomonas abbreviata, Strain Caron Lab Isolate" /LENGTH=446 /DNA_ID=CAMNT_0023419253 /DNA_START=19 /DNA_END=1359 /DNA_ORIENTATION=+
MDPFGVPMRETAPGLSTPSPPEFVEKPVDAMPVSPPPDDSGVPVAAPVSVPVQAASGGPGVEMARSPSPQEVLNAAEAQAPEVEIPTDWVLPDLPQKKNWNTSNTARLVHVVMESRIRKFALQHQRPANRMELQAQQTPSDKFWTIVQWTYNVAYDVEWFAPQNEFLNIQAHVDNIDPAQKDQFRDVAALKKQWAETKKRMNVMLEKYGESGGAQDVTQPGSNHCRFYSWSGQRHEGGKCGRADAGYYYAFLMACKHVILQRFVEAVLDWNTRFSGNLLLPDGTAMSSSFLDTASTAGQAGSVAGDGAVATQNSSSSMGSEGSAMSSGWKRKVEQACDNFRAFFGEQRAREDADVAKAARGQTTRNLGDNIQLMKGLHEQFMGLNGCISRTDRSDPSWDFLQEELANVQQQIRALLMEMRGQQALNAAEARAGVIGGRALQMEPTP